jgi:predicted nucleic acid-binding protein
VDYFRGKVTRQTELLDSLLGNQLLAIGDLILTEVLQGFDHEREFRKAKLFLTSLEVVDLGGEVVAVQAAENFRKLRSAGVTVRKTIDCIIATWCIENGNELLHSDRDFDAFEEHLGLRAVK